MPSLFEKRAPESMQHNTCMYCASHIATQHNVPLYDDGYALEPIGNLDQMLALSLMERLNCTL